MTKEQIKDLILMVAETDTGYPAPWSQVPDKHKDDFKSWVEEEKQQTWDGMWEKGWYNYHLEYLAHLLTGHLHDATTENLKITNILKAEREQIESDERYSYPLATVDINAPLALIQATMEAKVGLLKRLEMTLKEE